MKRIFYLLFIISAFLCSASSKLYDNGVFSVYSDRVIENYDGKTFTADVNNRTIKSDYVNVKSSRDIKNIDVKFPQFQSGHRILDILYDMAIEEIILNTNSSGYFVAGEKWNQAWTRDMSYAIYLGLAQVFNKTSIDSLRTRIYNGNILQDTGTGGSYPVSTDRMTWVTAAYETAISSGDEDFFNEVYEVSKRAMLQDLMLVYNNQLNLFKGEQSFLDWREQTYPKWMTPLDIGESYALGTNIVHNMALERLSYMAERLGFESDKEKWDYYREKHREGINKNLWSDKFNHWGSYLIGGVFPKLYEGYETLGVSLAVISGFTSDNRVLNIVKPQPYGLSVVSPRLAGIPPYHNDGIWPFVQGYRALAAAKAEDMNVFNDEFFSLVRSASMFLTFKENMVGSSGNMTGTQINSDRQLWSVASYLGMVYRGLAGLNFSSEGIRFSPVKPDVISNSVKISNFKYLDAVLDIEVSGSGTVIESLTVNGKSEGADYILPYSAKGKFNILIKLKKSDSEYEKPSYLYDASSNVRVIEGLEVVRERRNVNLSWSGSKTGLFHIYRNGEFLREVSGNTAVIEDIPGISEYWVSEYREGLPVLKGKSVWTADKRRTYIAEAETSFFKGGNVTSKVMQHGVNPTSKAVLGSEFNRFSHNGSGFIEKWGGEEDDFIEFTLRVPSDGEYLISFRYMNGGPVNTGERCSIKELSVNGEFNKFAYFPHTGNWRVWEFSSPAVVGLKKGVNKVKLYNTERTYSQKEYYPIINIDLMKADYFR